MISRLIKCLDVISKNNSDVAEMFGMCCNNAACALSEIAVYGPEHIRNLVPQILTALLAIINKTF